MSPRSSASILRELVDPSGPPIITLGSIPVEALVAWPERFSDIGIITRRQRMHYVSEHREIEQFESLVIEAVVAPDAVAIALDNSMTGVFYKRRNARHDIAVVVKIADRPGLNNSVISARQQHRTRRGRPPSRLRLVWEAEESGDRSAGLSPPHDLTPKG